jgi:hypothetical protein
MGEVMNEWRPILDRGDGVWIGVVAGNALGVGSPTAVSKRITNDNYIPLWPLLESELDETLTRLTATWRELSASGVDAPASLALLVVKSALDGDRPYWVELSARWLVGMTHDDRFDQRLVRELLARIAASANATQATRHQARRAFKSMKP